MALRSLLNKGKSSSLLFLILLGVALQGCKLKALKVDPCAVDEFMNCHAVPLNSPKQEYDRSVNKGDICLTSDEYAEVQKAFREMERRINECN